MSPFAGGEGDAQEIATLQGDEIRASNVAVGSIVDGDRSATKPAIMGTVKDEHGKPLAICPRQLLALVFVRFLVSGHFHPSRCVYLIFVLLCNYLHMLPSLHIQQQFLLILMQQEMLFSLDVHQAEVTVTNP